MCIICVVRLYGSNLSVCIGVCALSKESSSFFSLRCRFSYRPENLQRFSRRFSLRSGRHVPTSSARFIFLDRLFAITFAELYPVCIQSANYRSLLNLPFSRERVNLMVSLRIKFKSQLLYQS